MASKTSRTIAKKTAKPRKAAPKRSSRKGAKPALLAGGNPQIAKAYGDAPVQAYIAAMPGWKSDVGRRLDALIARAVPGVHKAVKWNSPFYGVEDHVWFLSFHCFTKYIKVAFFRGASLRPMPPGASKQKDVRYLDIHEDDKLDEAQFVAWVRGESIARRKNVRGEWRAMKKTKSGVKENKDPPSRLIGTKIRNLADWRGDMLARVRKLIKEADPDIVEVVKWRKPSNPSGVPVWEHDGIVCTGETYKAVVKLTFARGASLKDPSRLFNASLEGNMRRAIDIREGDTIDRNAFKALIQAAVAVNTARSRAN